MEIPYFFGNRKNVQAQISMYVFDKNYESKAKV